MTAVAPKTRTRVDYTGRTIGPYLTVKCRAGTGEPTRSYPRGMPLWLCGCSCGGEIVLTAERISPAVWRANVAISCRACRGKRAAANRERAQDLWDDTDLRRRFRVQWREGHSLWSGSDSFKLYNQIRHDFGLQWQYDGPLTHQPANGIQPDDSCCEARSADPWGGCATLQECADALGVSRERVRQIEAQAIHKIAVGLYRIDPALFNHRKPRLSDLMSRADTTRKIRRTRRQG